MSIPALRDRPCLHTIRFLSLDAVHRAGSGHPGMSLGAAPMDVDDRREVLGVERCGASAPADIVLGEHGFTVERVLLRALSLPSSLRAAHGQ